MRALFSLPFRLLRRLLRSLMLRTVADMRGGRKRYAKEALLRDIHEYTAVWAYLVGAAFLFLASEMALLVPSIAWAGSAVFLYRAWVRGCHGYYVASYQRNLLRLPLYRMESRALRHLKNQFVGMGFQWKSIHAQRLYDIELHKNERFTRFSDGYDRARDYCSRQHHGLVARGVRRRNWKARHICTPSACRKASSRFTSRSRRGSRTPSSSAPPASARHAWQRY